MYSQTDVQIKSFFHVNNLKAICLLKCCRSWNQHISLSWKRACSRQHCKQQKQL